MRAAWLTVTAAAILAGAAVALALAGLTQPAAWMVAAPLAAASYALWNRGHERMVSEIYGDGFEFDDDRRRERTEDWHRDWPPDDDVDDDGETFEEPWPDWEWAEQAGEDRDDDVEWTYPGENSGGGNGGARDRDRDRDRGRGIGDGGTGRRGWSPDGGVGRRDRRPGGTGTGAGGATRTVDPEVAEASDVLGVDPDADAEAVRAAYRERAKETHPDAGGSREAFKRVQWAYEVLADR